MSLQHLDFDLIDVPYGVINRKHNLEITPFVLGNAQLDPSNEVEHTLFGYRHPDIKAVLTPGIIERPILGPQGRRELDYMAPARRAFLADVQDAVNNFDPWISNPSEALELLQRGAALNEAWHTFGYRVQIFGGIRNLDYMMQYPDNYEEGSTRDNPLMSHHATNLIIQRHKGWPVPYRCDHFKFHHPKYPDKGPMLNLLVDVPNVVNTGDRIPR